MSDPVARLNAALQGRYAIERELGEGGTAGVYPQESAFDRGYEKLLSCYAREGHARVKLTHVEDGYRLGQWAGTKRGKYGKDELPQIGRAHV